MVLTQQLTYGRECPIHVHFILESADFQLLNLMTPSVFKIQLVQQIQIRIRKQRSEGSSHPYTIHKLYKGDADTDTEEVVVTGSCWRASSTEGPQNQYQNQQTPRLHRKHFEGEIMVRKDLKPSFQFPRLNLQVCEVSIDIPWIINTDKKIPGISIFICSLCQQYFVQVSFQVPGFAPSVDEPSISEFVTIVTDKPKASMPQTRTHTHPASSRVLPQSRLDP